MEGMRCMKCGGTVLERYGERSCINCGTEQMTPIERRGWYTRNKRDIILDAKILGIEATLAKYGLPAQMTSHIKTDPLYLESNAAGATAPAAVAVSAGNRADPGPAAQDPRPKGRNGELPPLPDFNTNWQPEVQSKWFDIWLYLRINK